MHRTTLAALTALLAAGTAAAQGPEPTVVIGSKQFTESVILGEMGVRLIQDAGLKAVHRKELGGTRILFDGLLAGELDAYPEYTGTLTQELLVGEDASTPAKLAAALARRGIKTSAPLGFHDSYALGMPEKRAAQLGITRLSDLPGHALSYGLSDEFIQRQDGWPGLTRAYGLKPASLKSLDHALAYQGVARGQIDVIDVYTTDPQIRRHDLRVLDDDRHYFPPYEAVWLYRADLEQRAPAAVATLRRLEGRIDTPAMQALNDQAMIERRPESSVAGDFLSRELGLAAGPPPASLWSARLSILWETTLQHLYLVVASLAAAVCVAVPLGVAAGKFPQAGRAILTTVSVIQTLPSLALLVVLIPLAGLTPQTAIVALFLYSLLPIVRNTATGLQDIPPALREAAEVLGLPAWDRLCRIELPLASRSILAGVKTAAVINVGTATIGALIGAGGYGAPILTGIRLSDYGLILLGAVPAAAMALGAQGLFDFAERFLVPRGLRLKPGD
jgi:osmoprotectant transport system permease protein